MSGGVSLAGPGATGLHVPLGRTGWTLWRDAALRAPGFPARQILAICDRELAAAADAYDDTLPTTAEQYLNVYAEAAGRITAAMRRIAADDPFREAVAWQNPSLLRNCLDKAVAGEPRRKRGRYHELTITSYLQRYCLKNDTIGFFGPVGWASFDPSDSGLSATPGDRLVSRRSTYFEGWAIDAVAEALASRDEVWLWLRPRRSPSATLSGWLLRPLAGKPIKLSAGEARLLARCDDRRTVRDLVGDPADPALVTALLRLREVGAIAIDLSGPRSTWPERDLAARIDAIDEPGVRARTRALLDELVADRDAVAAASGHPGRLEAALGALATTFERVTGRTATRKPGSTYVGRTVVYEDTVRDLDVHIGRRVTDPLARPLAVVLDSALWLANTIADRYAARAGAMLDQLGGEVPLSWLMGSVLPDLGQLATGNVHADVVDEVVAEFQTRWRRVLGLTPEDFDRPSHRVDGTEVTARAAAEFATGPPRWPGARWHCPDLMLIADDPAALDRGDVDVVLGEVHCAINTLETRVLVAQHPAPERLRAMAAESGLDGRICFIPRRGDGVASHLSWTDEIQLPTYVYVSVGAESMAPPSEATTLSLADLVAKRRGTSIVVTHRDGGAEYGFAEVAGELFGLTMLNAFRPIGGRGHRPRVTIDRMVLSRETWVFPAADVDWAFLKDEAMRYAGARRWRSANGLPERAFFRVPAERKPMAVDFRSLPLVNLLGKAIRRSAIDGSGDVTITEMLPDIDRLWLTDAAGERYTAELRVVAVREPVH